MRYSIVFVLLSIFFSINAQVKEAVKNPSSNIVSENLVPIEKSLLWKIEGQGLKVPSFLFGTIHMIPAESYFLPPNTMESVNSCERMTFEINMDDMQDMSAQLSLMMNIFMKNGTTLPELITADEYKMVQEHFEDKELPLPSFMLDKIKPMFLSIMASTDMDFMGGAMTGEEKQLDGIKSYEMEFMDMATKNEMEMAGLETMEYQMSMFDSIPYLDQAKMLVDAIKLERDTSLSGDSELSQLIEHYTNQNLEALQAAINDEANGIAEFEDLLLVQRNKNWIPIMKEQMKEKPTFFAVGAGHLGGPNGVIALLRKEGYELQAISEIKK